MKLEEAAFVNLVVLARADGLVTSSESSLLERYRGALGITDEQAGTILEKKNLKPLGAKDIQGKPSDRLHILKLMIRMAHVDGKVSTCERRLLKKIAHSFGIGRLALKSLFLEIEQELGVKRRLRVSQVTVAAVLVVAVVAVWITFRHFSSKAESGLDETRIDLNALKAAVERDRAEAAKALAKVKESQKKLAEQEKTLAERLKEVERNDQRAEVDQLKRELERLRSINTVFQEIEKEYAGSIFLIYTTYDLAWKTHRVTRGSMGSGFFVSSSGHIVTNKHVVQPWKFNADDIMLMDNGFAIDESTLLMAAWPAGSEVKTDKGELSFDEAYSTVSKDLDLAATAADTFVKQTGRLESGMTYEGEFHTLDHGDLAVLKASPAGPVKPLPLAGAGLEKLDPVMVLGFPTGIHILETTVAETSPSLGEVRKIEKSIMVTAPIVSGNSGGPLVDEGGHVVGVASGTYGEATLGSCIPASHILLLLPEAADLLEAAKGHEDAGAYRAALDDLRLAGQRTGDEKEQKAIDAARARILEIRDRMLKEAGQAEENERAAAYKAVVDLFGVHPDSR